MSKGFRSSPQTIARGTALVLGGVAVTSAAGLAFEIALTRVFAITQFYHFAFLSVSLALLGFGASGSVLAAFPRLRSGGSRRWAWLAAGQSLTMVGSYALTNALPFDSFAIAWDGRQVLYLIVYYLALAVPFFFGGLIVAILLAGADLSEPIPSHRVYAASLAGSGFGAVMALGGLAWLGGEATIALAAAFAMGGASLFGVVSTGGRRFRFTTVTITIGLLATAIVVPAPLKMALSPYKELPAALRYPGAEIDATGWDQGTRIDLIRSDGIRSLPGLSLTYSGTPPHQDGVTFDGDNLSPVPRHSPAAADYATHLLSSLAYRLRPAADTLILEPHGGLNVVVALANGAGSVLAVEPHRVAVEVIRTGGASPYEDPRVTVSHTDPRTFVERTGESFDIIDLALTSPYRPVTSGAYSLTEDYQLTVEAFERYLDRLGPGGILTVAGWVQIPPSEETRLLAIAVQALRNRGNGPASAVIMLRSYATNVVLVRPDGFTPTELEQVERFAQAERFDIVAAPQLDPTNQFNIVPNEQYSRLAAALLNAPDLETVYRAHQFDIAAPTDDRPFFSHFFKWSQASTVLDTLGLTWQPFGGAGYFVLIALLVISTLAALVLIAAPLLVRRRTRLAVPGSLRWWTLGYFGLLGLAFLFVEIPLIQQYILLMGRPTIAFAVVVGAVLVASGIGSAWSRRIPWRLGAFVLTALALAYPFLIHWLTPLVLPASITIRIVTGAVFLFPLGFMMGIMFPWGLVHVEQRAPHLVPWAWAINGTVSVIAAAAAAILALSFGFSFVVLAGAVAYGAAALLARSVRLIPGRG